MAINYDYATAAAMAYAATAAGYQQPHAATYAAPNIAYASPSAAYGQYPSAAVYAAAAAAYGQYGTQAYAAQGMGGATSPGQSYAQQQLVGQLVYSTEPAQGSHHDQRQQHDQRLGNQRDHRSGNHDHRQDQRARSGHAAASSDDAQGYVGTVKRYNPHSGWGLIECAETYHLYERDILLLKSELRGAEQGDTVSFSVAQDSKGSKATNVVVISKGAGSRTSRSRGDGQRQQNAGQLMLTDPGSVSMGTSSFTGSVKSYNPQKGWGLIDCKESFQQYGRDVLILKSEAKGAAQGDTVTFNVMQDEKGIKATDVTVLSRGGNAGAGSVADIASLLGQILGSDPNSIGAALQKSVAAVSQQLGNRTFIGTMKYFNEEKGWGFIQCDSTQEIYAKDVFASKSVLKGQTVNPGDHVAFKVSMGNKGPQAEDVNVLPENCIATEHSPGSVFTGTIKSFNGEKGWGLITSDEVMQVFGGAIFVHKSELGGQIPSPGDSLQFSVTLNKGKLKATCVNPSSVSQATS